MKNNLWLHAATVRAFKTIFQCFVAMLGLGALSSNVQWDYIICASILAGSISLMLNKAFGIPESRPDGVLEIGIKQSEDGEVHIYRLNLGDTLDTLATRKSILLAVDTKAEISRK